MSYPGQSGRAERQGRGEAAGGTLAGEQEGSGYHRERWHSWKYLQQEGQKWANCGGQTAVAKGREGNTREIVVRDQAFKKGQNWLL